MDSIKTTKDTLLSKEEFNEKIKSCKGTAMGKVFPVIKEEIPLILVICLNLAIASTINIFMKQSKDLLLCNELDESTISWLRLISFIGSLMIVKYTNSIFSYNENPYRSILVTNISTILFIMLPLIGFVVVDRFIVKTLLNGATNVFYANGCAKLRGFLWFKPGLLLSQNFLMAVYYIAFDIVSSNLITVIFPIFMSSYLSSDTVKRYYAINLIIMNSSQFFIGYGTKLFANTVKKVSHKNFYLVYVLMCVITGLLYCIFYLTNIFMNSVCSKPIYSQSTTVSSSATVEMKQKEPSALVKKKPHANLSFFQILKLIRLSKLLTYMCIVSASYSFYQAFFNMYVNFTYSAIHEYFTKYPAENNDQNFKTDKVSIRFKYQINESRWAVILTTIIVLLPFNRQIFDYFGLYLHGVIPILIGLLLTVFSLIFSAINYPFTNNKTPILLIGDLFRSFKHQHLKMEVFCITLGNALLKTSKFACYDLVRDSLSIAIHPDERMLFKGIAEGLFPKFSRTLTSIVLIAYDIVFRGDCRYTIAVTAFIIVFLAVCYYRAILFISKRYDESKKEGGYISTL